MPMLKKINVSLIVYFCLGKYNFSFDTFEKCFPWDEINYVWLVTSICLWVQHSSISPSSELGTQEQRSTEILSNHLIKQKKTRLKNKVQDAESEVKIIWM